MVKVKIQRDSKRLIQSVEISGHAESGPYGHDLVCASVSAIAFGGYNSVVKLAELEMPVDVGSDGGYLFFTVPDDLQGKKQEKVQLLLEGMLVSLQTIENDYSEYIKIYE